MATPDTVVPNSLNYTDIKPQAIENKIMLTRYQPTATITGAKGGDMVKFLLSGNGFLDPYSTYFDFTVEVPLAEGELKWVDRSAHSFIQRLVVRSQGVEIERLENYDVSAAMINDMIYSPEQCVQHYWEGFPTHSVDPSSLWFDQASTGACHRLTNANRNTTNFRPNAGWCLRDQLFRWLNQGASPAVQPFVGEACFHELPAQQNAITSYKYENLNATFNPIDFYYLYDFTYYQENTTSPLWAGADIAIDMSIDPTGIGSMNSIVIPVTFAYHSQGRRIPSHTIANPPADYKVAGNVNAASVIAPMGTRVMRFMIPIYSGILGLLMPEKKLLPLNILPLDIEIVFNRHALYSSKTSDVGGTRDYVIKEFFLYGNTLFFEQEIHRTLEASVADHGLFIYCNSFHSAPVTLLGDKTVPTAMYISMNLKSINSVHWVFMYTHFETIPCARKLHFVSHNLKKLQLLNGTQLIPQYPIEGYSGTSQRNEQLPFLVELYKAWNKMHDPQRDGALHAYNMCGDEYACQFDPIVSYGGLNENADGPLEADIFAWSLVGKPRQRFDFARELEVLNTSMQVVNKQSNVGRCQYGISLEGEELGSDRTMITGRKSQYPFQLQMWSEGKYSKHPSYQLTFIRADFIVYIRPDLQIVTLGK